MASRLKARLADLDAAAALSAIVVGRPRTSECAAEGDVLVDLTPDTRLVLRVNHQKVPRTQDGTVDWSRVSRVKIMRVEAIE